MEQEFSLGQYRVGASFNPSGSPLVNELKEQAARLIDLINDRIVPQDGECARLKALAMTEIESAAMWAVKAATKESR